jgi:hypothetical protein
MYHSLIISLFSTVIGIASKKWEMKEEASKQLEMEEEASRQWEMEVEVSRHRKLEEVATDEAGSSYS